MPLRLTQGGMICTFSVMTHTDLINLWPSLSDFASDLGVQYGTAKAMRRRNSIPPIHWGVMIDKAKARRIKGITDTALRVAVPAAAQIKAEAPSMARAS